MATQKFEIKPVENPVKITFIIDQDELNYLTNMLLAAKDFLPVRNIGLAFEMGRSLMVIATVFDLYHRQYAAKQNEKA